MSDVSATLHPWYGPCDGFGPYRQCSVCTGIIECNDGTWIASNDPTERVIRQTPWSPRLKVIWHALTAERL